MNDNLTLEQAKSLSEYYAKMKGSEDLSFAAIGGNEGNRKTYVAKLSFTQITEHFNLICNDNAPEGVMLQRNLAKSRGNEIKRYIQENEDFVFPSLIAIVEAIEVLPLLDDSVKVTLKARSFRYFVDGQGRMFGIQQALAEEPKLANNMVDVKFIISEGVAKDAQVFTDINNTPKRPNASQCIAMDSRLSLSVFAKEVVANIPCLRHRVDFTKASVTNRANSEHIWTLNQISKFLTMLTGATPKSANSLLADKTVREKWIKLGGMFFEKLNQHPHCKEIMMNGCGDWSRNSIVPTAVFLKSLALFLKVALMNGQESTTGLSWDFMEKFKSIELTTDNSEFLGRCLNYRYKLEDKTFNHKALASYFCSKCDLHIPDELLEIEEEVLISRASILKAQREEKQAELAL